MGRVYFAVVKPFHRLIVASLLARFAARLEPPPLARRLASWLGVVGGLLVAVTGAQHFPLAAELQASTPFAALSGEANDLVVLLCLCVGILLLFVGLLSVAFARGLRIGDPMAKTFFLAAALLLVARTALEVR